MLLWKIKIYWGIQSYFMSFFGISLFRRFPSSSWMLLSGVYQEEIQYPPVEPCQDKITPSNSHYCPSQFLWNQSNPLHSGDRHWFSRTLICRETFKSNSSIYLLCNLHKINAVQFMHVLCFYVNHSHFPRFYVKPGLWSIIADIFRYWNLRWTL